MPTDTGVSADPGILGTLLEAYRIKSTIDIETKQSEKNVPDRVDVATGGTTGAAAKNATMPPWTWAAIGIAALVAGALLLKSLK